MFRHELLDDFEITAHIVQPSVDEMRAEGMQDPSPFPTLLGFRSIDLHQNYRAHLKRGRRTRETYDIVLRASKQQLSFTINEQKPIIQRRNQVQPGYLFLEMPKNSRCYVTSLRVRENLPPDPALVAAAERASKAAPAGSGMPGFPPGMFGPMGGMVGPGGPGMLGPASQPSNPGIASGAGTFGGSTTPLGAGSFGAESFGAGSFGANVQLPPPSRRESLLSHEPWSIPKLGNQSLDTAIIQDVQLEPRTNGMAISKTSASGGFWLVWKIHRQGDFTATSRVSIPAQFELAAVAGPETLVAVGLYSMDENEKGLTAPAPMPLPDVSREFELQLRRSNGKVSLDVAGTTLPGDVTTDGAVQLGLFARGGIRFAVYDSTITPAESTPLVEQAKTPPVESETSVPATREWTDAGGTRKIEATFIKLEDDKLTIRRKDGKEFTVPLSAFIEQDQEIARRLAKPK
jgi:hypothetical protein